MCNCRALQGVAEAAARGLLVAAAGAGPASFFFCAVRNA
jgi:hypothetical protein